VKRCFAVGCCCRVVETDQQDKAIDPGSGYHRTAHAAVFAAVAAVVIAAVVAGHRNVDRTD
jgi:hypothetical protein